MNEKKYCFISSKVGYLVSITVILFSSPWRNFISAKQYIYYIFYTKPIIYVQSFLTEIIFLISYC